MIPKTKIVCTIGPSVNSYHKILELIDAGMNVARLNFSHASFDEHLRVIELLKKAREEKRVSLAIMLDTKGPEIRVGSVPQGQLELVSGDSVTIIRPSMKKEGDIILTPEVVFDCLEEGLHILFDDGYISGKVTKILPEGAAIQIQNSGVLKSYKGVNIPGKKVPLPAMTPEDVEAISFGCLHNVDIIAASFIRSKQHLQEIRDFLQKQGKPDIFLIAKIEDPQGVENFDEILSISDGIMVARGDLGVEMPLQEVPSLQKKMIQKCYTQGKPVITATQMLESMIYNPRPTRAEVSDVANAIYDSTSAVMLSGETAIGHYPIQAVKLMREIVLEAERHFPYRLFLDRDWSASEENISSSVAFAAVKTAYAIGAKAIFVFTNSGFSARNVSQFRPYIPIFALSPHDKTYHQLALSWGVHVAPPYKAADIKEAFSYLASYLEKQGIVQKKDVVVVTAGNPFGIQGTTNMMIVDSIS